jgi:hypothetical protein
MLSYHETKLTMAYPRRPTQRAPDPRKNTETTLALPQGKCGAGSLRVFKQFSWRQAGSVKVALSHPTRQPITQAVGCSLHNVNHA